MDEKELNKRCDENKTFIDLDPNGKIINFVQYGRAKDYKKK